MDRKLNIDLNITGRVSLTAVSKRLGIPENIIIALLNEAGYDVKHHPFTKLGDEHLQVLSQAYLKAVKSHYNVVIKNLNKFSKEEIEDASTFFSRFIRNNSFFSFYTDPSELVFKEKLDDHLILNFFYDLIEKIEFQEYISEINSYFIDKVFNRLKYKLKIKLKSKFSIRDFRLNIQSILVCFHYHIFPDDEDEIRKASEILRFSGKNYFAREALKLNQFLKLTSSWKLKTLNI